MINSFQHLKCFEDVGCQISIAFLQNLKFYEEDVGWEALDPID